ncbi:unnamed protein product [Nezara viridula]|uniref:Uncharacterized protein n=1 Tax=Nezara viridula TaxID=85310 RepID=A0A9P0E8G5_NEZVI|nr:unnamed protein product [Nezara viridula]
MGGLNTDKGITSEPPATSTSEPEISFQPQAAAGLSPGTLASLAG